MKTKANKGTQINKSLWVVISMGLIFTVLLSSNVLADWWYGTSPTAYWNYNGNLYDTSDTRNHNLTGGVNNTYGAGKLGTGRNFTGIIEDNSTITDFDVGLNNFTIALWVKANSSLFGDHRGLISTGQLSSAGRWTLYMNGVDAGRTGNLTISDNTLSATSTINITDNQWHRIVFVRNGTIGNNGQLYIDGVLNKQLNFNQSKTTGQGFYIGAIDPATSFYYGQIDDVIFYNSSAWTYADVIKDYNLGLGLEANGTPISYSTGFNPELYGNTNTVIYFNITTPQIPTSVNLIYNSSLSSMSLYNSNSSTYFYRSNFTTPPVSTNTNITFNISFTIAGSTITTTNYNQNLLNVPNINITSVPCSPLSFNFTLYDEENQTQLIGTYKYDIYYGTSGNTTAKELYGQVTNVVNLYICTNSTFAENFSIGYGEISYTSPGYVDRKYYIFDNVKLTSTTKNVNLYNLLSSVQISFKLEVEDYSLIPFKNRYTGTLRWYPEFNEYRTVEMGKTDESGNTVLHIRTEDIDYRIAVYEKNGTLIKMGYPVRFICSVNPCTYTLKVGSVAGDFTSIYDVSYTLNYNYTTGIWLFIYSDSSGLTGGMNLTVYKITGTDDFAVCSETSSGISGTITCNSSLYTGTLKAVIVRTASPGVVLTQKMITTISTAFKSSYGLFLSVIIAIPIIFAFAIVSPFIAILGGIIALIPALYFGSINITIVGAIALLGGLVMHFIRRVS